MSSDCKSDENNIEIIETKKGKLTIELLEEKTIGEGHSCSSAIFSEDGVGIVTHYMRDGKTGPFYSYTLDKGDTWIFKEEESPVLSENIRFSDNTYLGIAARSINENDIDPKKEIKKYIAKLRRSNSVKDLLEGKWKEYNADMQIPYLYGGQTDGGDWYLGNCDGDIVEMPNGDLVNTMSGHFKFDKVPIPYYQNGFGRQYRVWTCISCDKGLTWQYLSTVASSYTFKVPEMAEGFNENGLVCTGENNLVCVMRTGGQPHDWPKCYFPLYASLSNDGGLSWDTPRMVAENGVKPKLIRMESGLLVCKTGRPGTFLVFSTDDGDTWTKPHIIDDYDAPWAPSLHSSSGYGYITEIEPGILLVLYDEYDNAGTEGGGFILKQRKYKIGYEE